jgi:uncharacterized protein (DUF1800 family)
MAMSATYLALNRFGLGWRIGDDVPHPDVRAALADDLARYDPAPPRIAALPQRRDIVASLAAYRADVRAGREAPPMSREQDVGAREVRVHYLNAAAARVEQAVTTSTPFSERLVHFWANHFAVSAQALPVAVLAGDHENQAIRPHVMGRFADLLRAATLHPAMLIYLDQAASVGPGSMLAARAARRQMQRAEDNDRPARAVGLNENLAREILELHTLGVRTVYSQSDVTAFARVLTGWTVAGLGQRADRLIGGLGARTGGRRAGGNRTEPSAAAVMMPGDAGFVDAMHEPGAQTIIGRRFAEDGRAQSLAVLDHLASHPATARHIATKLARHFSADTPLPSLVARLERAFLDSDGDLPTLYRILIAAPECWQTDAPKFKTPWDWTISLLRASGMRQLPDRRGVIGALQTLGQPIWQPGSPAGYDDTADHWVGASGLMLRAELAARAAGGIADSSDPRGFAARIMADAGSAESLAAVARADSAAQGIALALMAPEFLRR